MNRPRPIGIAAVLAALLSVAVLATNAGGIVALLGAISLAAGVGYASRSAVTAGATLQFLGSLVAGTGSTGSAVLMLAVAGTILAWDFGQYATDLDETLDADAVTQTVELVRVAGGTLLAALAIGGLSVLRLTATVPSADPAITGLLFAGAVLVVAGFR